MKKFAILLTLILLCGCKAADTLWSAADGLILQKKAEKLCEKVYECFAARDADALEELFCEKTKNTHDLSDEIARAFEFISGNIVSYKSLDGNARYHFYDLKNNVIVRNTIRTIKTDNGGEYSITVSFNLRYADSDYVGVQKLAIAENEDFFTVGELFETIIPIDLPEDYLPAVLDSIFTRDYFEESTVNVLLVLKNQDKDKLYNMFAKNQQGGKLSDEIDVAFDFIDGNIISHGYIEEGSGGYYMERRKYASLHQELHVYDIMTDSGDMYELQCYTQFIDKYEPNEEGIHLLIIKRVEQKLERYGEHDVIEEIRIEGDVQEW